MYVSLYIFAIVASLHGGDAQPCSPSITTSDVIVERGRNVMLTCGNSALPSGVTLYIRYWEVSNGTAFGSFYLYSSTQGGSFSGNSHIRADRVAYINATTVELKNIAASDARTYRCRLNIVLSTVGSCSSGSSYSKPFTLTVIEKPQSATVSLTPSTVTSGVSQQITCLSLGGTPVATITMLKGQQTLTSADGYVYTAQSDRATGVYTFTPIAADNGVQITCRVTSAAFPGFQDDSQMTLNVLYPPGPAAATPGTITKTTGQSVTFQCSVNSVGNPSTTTWQWSTDTSITLPSSSTSQLTLSGLTVSHDGKYYCTPSNSIGAGTRAEITLIVNKPPVINPALPDQSVSVLSQFSIDCHVEAKPRATVEWKLNNSALPAIFTSTTVKSSSGKISVTTVTLTWSSSSTSDQRKAGAGVLTCSATNTAVTSPVIDTVNLDVQYPPGRATVDGGQSSTTVTAVEGQPHILNCEFTDKGNPQATSFDWYVHGATHSNRQAASYQISQPALSDSGAYQCRPYNTIGGGDPATIRLNVYGKPDPPAELSVSEFSAISVTVEWTSNKNGGYEQIFTVHYKASGEDWQYYTNIQDPGYKQRGVYKVQRLQEDTQYTFRVQSKNKYGSGGFSNEFSIQTKAKPFITESTLSMNGEGDIATVTWSPPQGEVTSYEIQCCVEGTARCVFHNVSHLPTTSAEITLPDGGDQYEFFLIVYQGDDAVVVTPLPFKQTLPMNQSSFPVGVVVVVPAAVVLVAVTGAFVFRYLRRSRQKHNNSSRNNYRDGGKAANELSVIQSRRQDRVYETPNRAEENNSAYAVLNPGNYLVSEDSTYDDIEELGVEVLRQNIKIKDRIGSGALGQVFKGMVFNLNDREFWTTVAVKTIEDGKGAAALKDLKNELKVMKTLSPHPNVIQLLASCTMDGGLPIIIMEYLPNGNLQDYLRKDRTQCKTTYRNLHGISSSLTPRDLVNFASEVASGMMYLSSMDILHRDLAARNILLDENKICKISDFGFFEDVIASHKYEKATNGRLPIRWMSPEALHDSIYSTQSDVWAYGVLLWEIVTLGSTPYPGMSAKQVMEAITEGYRMPQPPHCSQYMYNIMLSCWEDIPSSRSSFEAITVSLNDLLSRDCDVLTLGKFEEKLYEDIDQHSLDEKC